MTSTEITRSDLAKDLEGYTVDTAVGTYRLTFTTPAEEGRYAIRPINAGDQYPATYVATLADAIDYLNNEVLAA